MALRLHRLRRCVALFSFLVGSFGVEGMLGSQNRGLILTPAAHACIQAVVTQ